MMKRIVKYSLGLLAVLVLLLLIAPFFFNVNDYKRQIEQEVEDATGRVLKIGSLQASLFPWVGVTLDDVVLANRLGFSNADFLKVKHLDVQVALLPLFSKELEIKRFTLDSPEFFMERNAKGEGNWEDFLPVGSEGGSQDVTGITMKSSKSDAEKSDQTPSGTKTSNTMGSTEPNSSLLAALSADSLVLKDGKFVWQDAQKGVRVKLEDIQIELEDVQLDRPIQAYISARLNGDKVEMDAQIGPLGDFAKINVNQLPAQLHVKSEGVRLKPFANLLPKFPEMLGSSDNASVTMDIQLEQRPDGVRLLVGQAALLAQLKLGINWKVEMPSLDDLRVHTMSVVINDKRLLRLQGDVKHLNKVPNYQFRIQGDSIERTWLEAFVPELYSMYAAHPAPWKQIKLGASIAGTSDRIDLRDVQLLLDDDLMQLSGSASFVGAPDIRLRIAAKTLHLDSWLPQPKEKVKSVTSAEHGLRGSSQVSDQMGAELTAKAPVAAKEPDLRFLKSWRVAMQLQVEKLLMRGLEMRHMRGVVKGDRGLFKLNPLSFNIAGGQVRETASLNVNHYPANWTESIHVSGIKLKPVLQALANTDVLDGIMQLDTNLKATGLLPNTAIKSLNGTGRLSLQNGRVKGFDIAGSLRNLMSLGNQSGSSQYTDFAQMQASFKIRKGIAKNDDLFMASPLFRLTGKGTVNLPESMLDYHARPKLIGSLIGQGDTLTVRKGLSVPIRIQGKFDALKVTPEIDAQSVVENVGGLLGSGGGAIGGILGQVLGGGKVSPPPKASTGQSGQSKPAEISPKSQSAQKQPSQQQRNQQQMQKAIEGLLGF